MDVKPSLIVLVNEIEVMNSLTEDSIRLIHATQQIQAMKKVIQIQEVVQLNLNIHRDFSKTTEIVWDVGALAALKQYRQEMIVYHSRDFDPAMVFKRFVDKTQQLLNTVQHRMQINL